jgi:glycosyltransferase involved in cell wall biosynthesis
MQKRVLFIVNAEWYFCLHWLPLAIGMVKNGYEIILASSDEKGERKNIEEAGIKFIEMPFQRQSINPIREIKSFIEIIRIIKQTRPNIVHNITIKPVILGTLASRILSMPFIVNSITGLGYTFIRPGLFGLLLRNVIKFIYRILFKRKRLMVTFQNSDDRRLLYSNRRSFPKSAIVIKGVGVNTTKYKLTPIPVDSNIVILASRLLWDKGVREFVEAAKYLHEKNVNVQMALVGEPDEKNPQSVSVDILNEWRKEKYIEWWGFQKNMPEVINKASIVVLPSYREGLPTILIEAASVGRPLIATDVPGCNEVVKNGVNGFLVPVKTHIELAKTIHKLIIDPILMDTMGDNSRRIALNEFDFNIILQQHLELYKSSLN